MQELKLALILLAAGDSKRFHGNKLLYEFHGKPMYRHIADEIEKLPENFFYRKVVVTQYHEIMDNLMRYGYEVVENKNSRLGISHSIYLGLETLNQENMDVCFAVCDQPYLKAATIRNLVKGWRDSKKGLGCLSRKGQLGNPAIFSNGYGKKLLNLHGDTGGKQIIRQHRNDLYCYEVFNDMELVDIDVRK